VVTKDELLSLVWLDLIVGENNLTVQISVLRKSLGPDTVTTVAGRGYRFSLPVVQSTDVPSSPSPSPEVQETDHPSIAVLPFEVLSEEPAVGFLFEDVIA
jgi:DNA-binding winged helix-turn-helix (wHTH) protein